MHFEDGTSADFDVIIYATGYNLTFPFFDPEFLSAPDNRIDLYKRIIKPGIDDLLFVGFAQSTPTLFPFVECQARLIAAYAVGEYLPPSDAEMHDVIKADDKLYMGHMLDRPRHTHQLDYFVYEHQMRTKELPGRAAPGAGPGRAGARRTVRDERRAATKGDERRGALLEALDHLPPGGPTRLDEINIADISRRAGVTRSAFYFYFENKAAAVAALMDEMYDEGWDAADLLGGDGSSGTGSRRRSARSSPAGVERTHLYRAMLEARATSPAVRDQWEAFQAVLRRRRRRADHRGERAAGLAPDGPDAREIATALLDLNDRTLERARTRA